MSTHYYTKKTKFTIFEKCKLVVYKILKMPTPFEEVYDGEFIDHYYGLTVKIKKPELRDYHLNKIAKQLNPNSWKTGTDYKLGDMMWLDGWEYTCTADHKSTVMTKDVEECLWKNADDKKYPHYFDSEDEMIKLKNNMKR